MLTLLCSVLLSASAGTAAPTPSDAPLAVPSSLSTHSFSRQIAPILLEKCLSCHEAQKSKGGYRVDTFQALLTPGKSNKPAVVPGKPEESELFHRLITPDEDDRMPQDSSPLSPEVIEIFREWIRSGAELDSGEQTDPLAALVLREPHPAPPPSYPRSLPILTLTFNSAGTEIFAGGYHEITVWDTTGKLQRRITNVAQRVHALALHPSGEFLVSAGGVPGRSGELAVYHTPTGSFEKQLLRTPDVMLAAKFNPSGTLLAAAGSDHSIHLFDWPTRTRKATLQQHADWVTAIHFSKDDKWLASASRDRTARVYSTSSTEFEASYLGHNKPLLALSFLQDGRVATGGKESAVHLWKIGEEAKKDRELQGFQSDVTQLVAHDQFLFAASADGIVRQYQVDDGKMIRTFNSDNSPAFALSFHPTSGLLACGSYDGRVRIWQVADGVLVQTFVASPGVQ